MFRCVPRSHSYAFNNANMITGITREDGENYQYGYDDLDRLTNAACYAAGGTVSSDEKFAYDEVGNRTSKATSGITLSYSYSNGCNRLSNWAITQTNLGATVYVSGSANEPVGTNSMFGQLWISNKTAVTPFVDGTNFWVYDLPMNLGTQQIVAAIRDMAGNTTFKTNTVTLSIVTNGTYGHNSAGCVTNIGYTGAGFSQNIGLTWNGQYQLSSVSTNGVAAERNGFDALGRRVWNWDGTTTNYFVYDGQQIIADVNATGGLVRAYVWGPGIDNLLAFTTYTGATAKTYFALTDHLGSVHALADQSGNIVESYRFDAWGRVLGVYDGNNNPLTQSAIGNRFLWACKEYSFKTGLYFNRYRIYDPITGRFLSKDPSGISGGMNEYIYCSGNPINYFDPDGLQVCAILDRQTSTLTVTDVDSGQSVTVQAFTGGVSFPDGRINSPGKAPYTPAPNGVYLITNNPHPKPGAEDWYGLLYNDARTDDYKDDCGRSGFRLHEGHVSDGCVTVNKYQPGADDKWNQVRNLINNTKTDTVDMRTGPHWYNGSQTMTMYGTLTIK